MVIYFFRKGCLEDKRPQKRLFTPEIKRFLKSWLIRRRDNPYPNRDEKKLLAVHTGLTYIQVRIWKCFKVPYSCKMLNKIYEDGGIISNCCITLTILVVMTN